MARRRDLRWVIQYLEECRDTHIEAEPWHFEEKPPKAWRKLAGSPAFHRKCAAEYQQAIDILQEYLSE